MLVNVAYGPFCRCCTWLLYGVGDPGSSSSSSKIVVVIVGSHDSPQYSLEWIEQRPLEQRWRRRGRWRFEKVRCRAELAFTNGVSAISLWKNEIFTILGNEKTISSKPKLFYYGFFYIVGTILVLIWIFLLLILLHFRKY
jgi:hypothetical protein